MQIKQSKFLPFKKVEEKERGVAVEPGKAKEENLKVAGSRCWTRILLRFLQKTGELFSWTVILKLMNSLHSDPNVTFLLQRLGSCPSSPFMSWWPTQSSPLPSTTRMADFLLFSHVRPDQWHAFEICRL